MSVRNLVVTITVIALGSLFPTTGRAEGKLVNNFINVKLGFPVNGLEYEHVFANGIGVSVAGSYLSANLDVDSGDEGEDDVLDSNTSGKASAKYTTLGAGVKKYIGDHRVLYFGAYVHSLGIKAKFEDGGDAGEGSLQVATVLAAVGGRGVFGHFTIGGEIGGGYLGLKDITYSKTEDGVTTQETIDVPALNAGPMAQLYLGFGF
jgi:hypothetical protein